MRNPSKVPVFALLLAALLAAACAHVPQEPSAAVAAAVNREWVKRGYQVATLNGQTFFCRYDAVTGTQFRTKVCLTDEQVNAEVQAAQGVADFLNQAHGIDCSGRQGPCKK